jgi:hypothetical protein
MVYLRVETMLSGATWCIVRCLSERVTGFWGGHAGAHECSHLGLGGNEVGVVKLLWTYADLSGLFKLEQYV